MLIDKIKIKMENYEDIPIVEQPSNFRIKLFRHQLAAIHKMEKKEEEKKISSANTVIESNVSLYTEITGYGKTAAMIGLILRDKMKWLMDEPYTHKLFNTVYGNGRIFSYSLTSYTKINSTLIVANQSLINQWKDNLNLTNLTHTVISTNKQAENTNPNDYDVIICSPTMYNKFIRKYPSHAWKRFVFDEPTHTKIPSMYHIMAGYNWFMTATPEMLLYNNRNMSNRNLIASLFSLYMDANIWQSLIVKNPDEFVRLSYSIPKTTHKYHNCAQPLYNICRGIVGTNILEMIEAGDISNAVKTLGGKRTDNILDLVKRKKQEELTEADMKITIYTAREASQINLERLVKWQDKKTSLLNQLKIIDDRFKDALSGTCSICFDTFEEPVMLSCCQNLFCGGCIIPWLSRGKKCPLCRETVDLSNIIYITSKKEEDEAPQSHNYKKNKQETIIEILKSNKDGKFIIFSSYDETFYAIRTVLSDENIKFSEVQGRSETRNRKINAFKSGDTNVMFLNSRHNGAGINLQEATDIILYHEMTEDLSTQIIGRANRIGREKSLIVHHLI